MKKIYLFIGSLLLMFVLLGCDGEGGFTLPADTTIPTGELTTDEFTTGESTTEIPTTIDGTTQAPTTEDGTTEVPTTQAPTTEVPTTQAPTTQAPTTEPPTTFEPEPVVLLDRPTNLSIDGTVLSWTEVPNAVGYSVYVDGNFQTEVTTNQYDFSSIVEDYLVFNVKALAYAEESDSNLSLDIVYNVNATSEISSLVTLMETSGMNVSNSQAFATELVSRGMTATEMQTMMTNMEPVMTKMQNQASMGDIYPDLHTFLNGMDNIEALVSAFVRVELPNAIQAEIDDLLSLDGTCEYYGEYYDEYSTDIVTECYAYYDVTEEVQYLNRLLAFVETYPDEVVESVMVVVNYLMRIENAISTQWVNDLDTLMDSTSPGPFDISLAVSVKNGLVNHFKDEMPSLNEFTVFNQTMMIFANTMVNDNRMDSFIGAEKTSMQMQMTLGLFFDALLHIDSNYITKMMESSESNNQADMIALQFQYLNTFLAAHEIELQALSDVYTAEEKEAIFFDLIIATVLEMEGFTETEQSEMMAIIKANIDFDNLLALQTLSGDVLNDLLDRLDETQYALIYAMDELSNAGYHGYYISDDDSGDGNNFNIGTYLEAGDYVLTVRGFSGYETGPYDLYIYTDDGSVYTLMNQYTHTLVGKEENQYMFTLTEGAYVNIYTDSSLDTYGELREYEENVISREDAMFNVLNTLLETMNPMVQDMTDAEYNVLITNMTSIIQTALYIEDYQYTLPPEQLLMIEEIIDIFNQTTPYQFVVLQTIVNQMEVNDYFTELNLATENQDKAQIIIIQLDLLNDVLDASALEFDTLDEIYTDAEKEAIFFDLLIGNILKVFAISETGQTDIMTIIESNIDFNDLLALQELSSDTLNDFLDQLALNQYELVYAMVDLMDVENTYYDDWNQYELAREEAVFDVLNALLNTMNPMVQDMTEVEYQVFMTNVTSIVKTTIYLVSYSSMSPLSEDDLLAVEQVFDIFNQTTPYQFVVLQTLVNQMEVNDYFTELRLAIDNEDQAQVMIIHLDLLNDFLDTSALEFDGLTEIYTDQEKEDIFFDLMIRNILRMQGLTETEQADIMTIIETNIDFTNLLALQDLSSDALNDLLDQLALTQYELVYAMVDLMEVQNTYYSDPNQYDLDHTQALAYFLDSFVNTMNPLVQDMTEAEYTLLMTNAISIFRTSFYIEEYHYPMMTVDEIAAVELVLATILSTTPEQFPILQAAMNQVQVSDMIMDIYNIYYNNPGTYTPEELDYGMLIILANVYVNTYDLVETDLDALIADVLLLLDNPIIQAELVIFPEDIEIIKTAISDYPYNLYIEALDVINYDYTNLTAAQIDELLEVIYWLETPYADTTTPA